MPKSLISVGELIDQSWDVYKSRMTDFLSISGWLIVTAIFFALSLAFYPAASKLQLSSNLTGFETLGVLLFSFTSFVIAPIMSFWIYISISKATNNLLSKQGINTKKIFLQTRSLFFPTILTSIMVVLMVLLAIVIGFAPPAIIATLGSLINNGALIILANVLLVLGIFISLVLSIKWVIHYFMAPYLTILEGAPSKLALASSRQLIEGKFWSVLIRVTVPKLVFLIFGVFAMSIFAYFVGILIDASAGINLDIQLRISTMTQTIVPIIIALFINPLIIISDILLLRSLKEG